MRRFPASILVAGVAVLLGLFGLLFPRLQPGVPPAVTWILVATALGLLLLALVWWGRAPVACEDYDPRLRRRYTRGLTMSMAAYTLVLFASVWLLKRVDAVPLRVLLALAPVLPIGFAVRAMVRFVRDIDEMQQRIELEAISIATLFVSMLYMTGGFLQSARLIQVPGAMAMLWVFPMVCFSYGVAKAIISRRYQ